MNEPDSTASSSTAGEPAPTTLREDRGVAAKVPQPPAGAGDTRRAEAIHDFAGKLRQPSLWPAVADYVEWQRSRRRAAAEGAEDPGPWAGAPLSINLDLTTACNYKCDHCIDWDILNSKVRHADDELRASLAQLTLKGLKSVILIGGGEPTLYPGFADFVAYLKRLGLQVAVVSNGSRGDRLLQAAPHFTAGDWVRLSLDSGSNEVFQKMHNPTPATLTLDEICSWIPKIKAANPALTMGFSFVITWQGSSRLDATKVVENIGEIAMAAKRAKQASFDYISYKPFLVRSETGSEIMDPTQAEHELDEIRERIRSIVDEARALEGDGFRVLESTNLRMLLGGTWEEFTKQPKTCHMQALRQVLTPLGMYNCPAHRGEAKALIDGKEAWSSKEHVASSTAGTRDMLDRFDASVECAEVTCLYHGVNWWLEDAVRGDAPVATMGPGPERADTFL